jgi:tape measure domain-containing protein
MNDAQLQIVISAKNDLERGIAAANQSLNSLGTSANNASAGVQKLGVGTIAIGTMLGGLFTQAAGAVFNFGKSMIKAAGDFEQTQVAFTTMLGSAEKANTLLRDLSDFAMKTPFTLVGLEAASKQLLAYGFGANEMVSSLKMMGDVAAGVSIPIGDISYLFGTLRAQGRVFTMDMRQFAGRGIPIWDELSKTMGKSVSEIQKMVSEGKVGFKDVENAFKSMTGEGGKFHNMMEKQSQTLMGRISNVDDAWTRFLRVQGSGLIVFANMAVDGLYKVLDWLNKDAQGANFFGKMIYGLVLYFTALGKTAFSVAKIIAEFVAIGIEGFIGLIKGVIAFGKDFINVFKNLKLVGTSLFSAFGKAIKGDFSGASAEIKKSFTSTFTNSIEQSKGFAVAMNSHLSTISSEVGNIGTAWVDFAQLKGFETAKMKFGSLGETVKKDIGGAMEDTSGKTKKLEDAFSKLTEKISDTKTKGLESLQSIGEKINDLTKQLSDLYSEKAGQQNEISSGYGDEYVKQEKVVSDALKELENKRKEQTKELQQNVKAEDITSHNEKLSQFDNEIAALQDKYNKESTALQQYSYIATQYATQVKDARIVANNTEFENAMENLRKKQDQIDIEFAGKKSAIEAELAVEVDKYNQVQKLLEQAFDEEKNFNQQRLKATEEAINKEIDVYNKKAEAISNAAQGKKTAGITSSQINKNLELSQSAYRVSPINITINANNVVGQNAGKELGNILMNSLNNNVKATR